MIDKESVGGVATRPSDDQLFGVGFKAGVQKLFKLRQTSGPGPHDIDVATVPGSALWALTFHPDGRLLATDGVNLLTLDPNTGAVLSHLPFNGASIGKVGCLAVTGPRIPDRPDVWLRDCPNDDGTVPSSPTPCAQWRRSPDIMIDNNGDGTRDPLQPGTTNLVKLTVRNRGQSGASGVVVRLYALTPNVGIPSTSRLRLVGERIIGSTIEPQGQVRVVIPWQVPAGSQATNSALAVVLDHPNDRPRPGLLPVQDNNKAIFCFNPIIWLNRRMP
jgi:hypothetical protein